MTVRQRLALTVVIHACHVAMAVGLKSLHAKLTFRPRARRCRVRMTARRTKMHETMVLPRASWLVAASAGRGEHHQAGAAHAQSASSLGNNTAAKTSAAYQGSSTGCENFSSARSGTNGSGQ